MVLQPLLAAGIFSFVFGMVAGMESDGQPYFLFSFAGLIGWKLFQGLVSQSSLCIVENGDLVSKVYFPRLAISLLHDSLQSGGFVWWPLGLWRGF